MRVQCTEHKIWFTVTNKNDTIGTEIRIIPEVEAVSKFELN